MRQAQVVTYPPQRRIRQGGARKKGGRCNSLISTLVFFALLAGVAVWLFAFDGLATLQGLLGFGGAGTSQTRRPTQSPVPTVPTMKPTPRPSDVRTTPYVQLVFATPSPSPDFTTAFNAAAANWSTILQGTILSDHTYSGDTFASTSCPLNDPGDPIVDAPIPDGTFDGLYIAVVFEAIDDVAGILGSAGPCLLSTSSSSGEPLPRTGRMKFDTADLAVMTSERLGLVILHEMAHVLGMGTLWESKGVLDNPIFPVGGGVFPERNPEYSGHAALVEYEALLGGTASRIPVEDGTFNSLTPAEISAGEGGGSIDGHWREAIFGTELMSPSISAGTNPLSLMSLRSLEDLGYNVNPASADAYALPLVSPGAPGTLVSEKDDKIYLYSDMWIPEGFAEKSKEALRKAGGERRLRGVDAENDSL